MELKLTRRQFGQMALAGTTVAAVGVAFSKTLAQDSNTVLFGVQSIVGDNSTSTNLNSNTTDLANGGATTGLVPSTLQAIVVDSFNVGTQEIRTVLTTAPILQPCEQLTSFVSLDGRLVVAVTNTCPTKKKDQGVRLLFLDSLDTVTVELKNNEIIRTLLRLADGSLAGLIGKRNGKPPFRLATINPATGKVTDRIKLREAKRVTAITQCPNGTFYAIETDPKGVASLFRIDQEQSIRLSFRGSPWTNGFSGLVCSSSNQLFALGALRYESPKYLHTINLSTGEMNRIENGFDVNTITLAS